MTDTPLKVLGLSGSIGRSSKNGMLVDLALNKAELLGADVHFWDLEKKKEHLEKEIEDFKKKIVQNEKEIKENIDLQAKKKEAIQIQDKKVKKVEQKLKELN